MIRVSKAQAALLFGTPKPRGPRAPRKKSELPENTIEAQICGFLRAHGWRVERMLAGVFKSMDGKRYVKAATKGIPDYICLRGTEYFLLETKGPNGKLNTDQELWIGQARRERIPVFVANNYERFIATYFEARPGDRI